MCHTDHDIVTLLLLLHRLSRGPHAVGRAGGGKRKSGAVTTLPGPQRVVQGGV